MAKLSVIIPCYNVAPYLERCMLSVMNQTLTDIEIICIDDCSTDNTLAILKEWARHDLRVRVLENNKNMGVGYTRNRGIDAATGEFVGFVDPDDWIDNNFYRKLLRYAERTKTPVVCGDVTEHDFSGRFYTLKLNIDKNYHNFRFHYSAIYLREFLNLYNICYPHLCLGEDTVFETMVKCNVPKPICHVPGVSYHYCRRFNSLNSTILKSHQVNDCLQAFRIVFDIYNNAENLTEKDYIAGTFRHFEYMYNGMFNSSIDAKDAIVSALVELFPVFRYPMEIYKANKPLYLALLNNDASGAKYVLKNQQVRTRNYYLFDRFHIATVRASNLSKVVYFLGFRIWGSRV